MLTTDQKIERAIAVLVAATRPRGRGRAQTFVPKSLGSDAQKKLDAFLKLYRNRQRRS